MDFEEAGCTTREQPPGGDAVCDLGENLVEAEDKQPLDAESGSSEGLELPEPDRSEGLEADRGSWGTTGNLTPRLSAPHDRFERIDANPSSSCEFSFVWSLSHISTTIFIKTFGTFTESELSFGTAKL